MGTRSLTKVIEKYGDKEEVILNVYVQYDGYPSGHGMVLCELLEDMVLVNGISSDAPKKIANGLGCLAAQLVAHLKIGPGGTYIHSPNAIDCGQEWEYEIRNINGEINVKVIPVYADDDKDFFEGNVNEFITFCNQY